MNDKEELIAWLNEMAARSFQDYRDDQVEIIDLLIGEIQESQS